MSERPASDFRDRARVEADRYGPDPWIFVRELLQNARDAGASKVEITVEERDGKTRIRCRDDGEGMSYEHARRYLFSLYASSKEQRANQVGRFGVGFWSILRFDPERIVIRSCPRGAEAGGAWQVVLDGELQRAQRADIELGAGTEILLERRRGDGADERRVFEAAHQNARYLCTRDDPDVPLPITVNGRSVNAEFALARPSAAFHRGHVRGVVGLGNAPRVELFSRGLRVRSAACLDDLLSNTGHTSHSRVRFPELPGGLAPQALLESDGLELLLSRSDARDTRTLRRLVKLGQDELRWLVERQLARVRPPGLGERFAAAMRVLAGESAWWRALLGAVTGAVLAMLIAKLMWPDQPLFGAGLGAADATPSVADRRVYTGLRQRYHGPQVSKLDPAAAEPLELSYTPSRASPYFAALIIEQVSGDAGAIAPLTDARYPSLPCSRDCLDVSLRVAAPGGTELPLPLPTGHRLDVASIVFEPAAPRVDAIGHALGAGPVRVISSAAGEPVLLLDWSFDGKLRYTTGPGAASHIPPRSHGLLPNKLQREAEQLRNKPLPERLGLAINLVQAHVRYDTSEATAERHADEFERGTDFITRTLDIAAGDCDVQNGLLVAILHAADIDARLAVGWVGVQGRVWKWLHAWVEYLDEDGNWRVADATINAEGSSASIARLPPPAPEVARATARDPVVVPETNDEPDPASPTTTTTTELSADAPPPSEPSPTDTSAPASQGPLPPAVVRALSQPWVPWLAAGSGLLGLVLLGASISRRTARRFQLDERTDLSGLLQGALAQPAAFRHLPSLFHRRLIPLRGGSAISLNRARTLASEGRLYAGSEQTELSIQARHRGVTLLDLDTPEGRTVASSLAAIDLDRWGHRFARATDTWALTAVSAYLREHGERWRCAALRGLGERVATLDLRPLGRRFDDRLVLVDVDDPWLVEAERMQATRPHTAVFALLDHLLDHLDVGPDRRAQLLAPLAAKALTEAGDLRHG